MTPTPLPDTTLSTRIRESVEKEQAKRLADMADQVRAARVASLLDRPSSGQSRLKAHLGQAANKKHRALRRRKAGRRSTARNRR